MENGTAIGGKCRQLRETTAHQEAGRVNARPRFQTTEPVGDQSDLVTRAALVSGGWNSKHITQ